MMKLLSAASVLAIAAGTQAAPFTALSYEAGNGLSGVVGQGFSVSSGGFYNRTGGTNALQTIQSGDPLTWVETATNDVAYDSYMTIDSGPSWVNSSDTGGDTLSPQIATFYGYDIDNDPSHQAATASAYAPDSFIGMSGDNDGQLPYANVATNPANNAVIAPNKAGAGVGRITQSVPSPSKPGQDGVFIAQFTITRGATLSGSMLFTIADGSPTGAGGILTLGGAPVTINGQLFALKAYLVGGKDNLSHSRSGGNTGSGSGSSQRFGNGDVYHLWIETQPVPTPGTLALAGLGGLVAFRRRRA